MSYVPIFAEYINKKVFFFGPFVKFCYLNIETLIYNIVAVYINKFIRIA